MRRSTVALAPLLLLLSGCSGPPQPFGLGQRIPLGEYTIAVTRTERLDHRGQFKLIVYLRCDQTASHAEVERFNWRLVNSFRLKDGKGDKYFGVLLPAVAANYGRLGAIGSITRQQADDLLEPPGGDPHEWAVLFAVPRDSTGFILHIKNPDRREGQPKNVSIDLGG